MRWINRTQSSFSESFFQLLTEDSSFFTIALYLLHNITLLIVEQSLRKSSWGESCNTVWSINGKQSSLSERFFPVFNGRYFLFHHSLLWTSKYHFANPTRKVLAKGFMRGNCNSVRWFNRTKSSFSESFFPVCNRRYFVFHRSPLWASKYHFENSTRKVSSKGFLRGKL